MKTLIIVAHPNIKESVIHNRWIEELQKYPDLYTVHNIYEAYPDGIIDVEKEQQLIDSHKALVLQFPLYWFNCTPLLKKWLDEVFLYGWAYGSKGNALKDKKIALAISAGIKESDFSPEGEMQVSFENLLHPYKAVAKYCKALYADQHILFDSHEANKNNSLENNTSEYINFLAKL